MASSNPGTTQAKPATPNLGNAAVSKSPGTDRRQITAAQEKFVEKPFQRAEGRIIHGKRRAGPGALGGAFHQPRPGIDDNRQTRAAPDGEVGGRIAGVIKAAFAEFFDERLELVLAAEIGPAIAGEHFIEKPDVTGNGQGHVAVGRRDQHQFPARAFLFAQKREKRFVVRQTSPGQPQRAGRVAVSGTPGRASTRSGPETARSGLRRSSRASDSQSKSVLMSVPSKSTQSGTWLSRGASGDGGIVTRN